MTLTDFEWCGQSGSLFGLIPCNIDSTSGTNISDNGATVEFTTVNVPGSNKWHFISCKYSSVMTGTFQVCKNLCRTSSSFFDAKEIRFINRWLCRNDGYHKFKLINDDEGYSEFYFNAYLTLKKIEASGHIIGLEITVTSDAPFAYFEPKTAIMNLSSPNYNYVYIDMSDEIGNLYPFFKITCNADGDYTIKNSLSGIQSKILGCTHGEVITMDSEHKILSSSLRGDSLLRSFNFSWLDIKNTFDERKNVYSSNLPCKIEMTYSPIAKIGF